VIEELGRIEELSEVGENMTDDSLERLMALYCAYCLGTGMMELVMRDQSREPCPVSIVTRAGASGTPAMPRSFNPVLCPPKSPSRRERSRKTQASRPGPNRGEWNADLTDRADRYGLKSRTRILMMTRIYADLKCGDSTPLFPLPLIIRENLPNPPNPRSFRVLFKCRAQFERGSSR
jgi:hypothetical protein